MEEEEEECLDDLNLGHDNEQNDSSNGNKEALADTKELAEFREKWRAELKKNDQVYHISRAEELYWMGVSAEEVGDMSSALIHYRQAIQLVPDIEQKISRSEHQERVTHQWTVQDNDTIDDINDLSQNIFNLRISPKEPLCLQLVKTRATHISVLPLEIFLYILRLAVLQDLDLRTLEQFGMVCKSFYMLARESLIWKQACCRLWGRECNPVDFKNSWRLLYVSLPHVHFNGVYVSQSSYVRTGEQSLDRLYKPFHTVVYYRYLRFHSDGTVAYLTCPQEPANVVGQMKYNIQQEGILFGHYSQTHSTISIVVKKTNEPSPTKSHGRSRKQRSIASVNDYYEQLHMEFEIINSRKKLMSQLRWKKFSHQSVHRFTGHVEATDFNIDYTYTPFFFSRVKSYSLIEQQEH